MFLLFVLLLFLQNIVAEEEINELDDFLDYEVMEDFLFGDEEIENEYSLEDTYNPFDSKPIGKRYNYVMRFEQNLNFGGIM
ncbi:hypothetical protein EHI8A_230300 [Entamoeba histolytica HM-1:IMSS-B]|uniref:Uncharacterized protein n=2 Tax=Entamoeba histolytica TaxID=5759 RepID=M3UNS2_ENTH1|nr:hypothetical protein EHI8A_230300 [Entamoeba histolytica HM-1:IMSS-B]EMS11376.1 hypothetical protein KM1_126200 [Entamoeba histolytica HM-3:IMSS]